MPYKYRITQLNRTDDVLEITTVPMGKRLCFVPGQYASVGYRGRGRTSLVRCFSLIGRGDGKSIRFGVRVTGPFTQALADLTIGSELRISGPFGDFYIDPGSDKRVVMLASGIGITPFLSMLERGNSIPTTLLYSNRSAASIPFHRELLKRAQQQPNLEIGFFASENVQDRSDVIPGRIEEQYMQRLTSGTYAESTYFVCGSSHFMQTMVRMLQQYGVPEDKIITESFALRTVSGYDSHSSLKKWTYGLSATALGILIFGITVLDLSRAVPKLAAVKTIGAPQASSTAPSTNANSSALSNNAAPANGSGSSTTASAANQSANSTAASSTATQPQTYYQPPVSSVS